MRRRLYLSFLVVAVVPTALAGIIGIGYSMSALKRETLQHLQREADTGSHGIGQYFAQLGSTLRYLANASPIHELILSLPAGIEARREAAALVQRDWLHLAASYPHLQQIRFLDRQGREQVRVDNRDGQLRVVEEPSLQDKSDRYYVDGTLALPPGQFYVSRLDLNVENGAVESPPRPVIRLATPLSDTLDVVSGLLVVNLDAGIMLRDLERMVEQRAAAAFLFDPDGFYIERSAAADSATFEARAVARFADAYGQDALSQLLGKASGTVETADWVFAHAPVSLFPEAAAGQQQWTIVLAYPKRALFLSVFSLYLLYAVLTAALLVSAVGGFLLSRHLLGPLESLTREAARIASGDFSHRLAIPGSDEIAVLGRQFNLMSERLTALMAAQTEYQHQLEAQVQSRTRELERQRGRLAAVIEHTAEGILAAGADGRVQLYNRAAERMLLRSDLTGATWVSIFGPQWAELSRELADWSEVRADLRRGERTLSLSATSTGGDSGDGGDVVLVLRDVSEERQLGDLRRELDGQMFQMEKLATLGELAMGLAHEIGNPLAGMKAVAQSLQYDMAPEDVAVGLARLEAEIDRLSTFLRSFHGFAAPQPFHAVPCLLPSLLEDVLFWVRKRATSQCVALGIEAADELPPVAADPAQLKQVLLNLVVNALNAMPDGGSLRLVATATGDGRVEMRICDTGVGIAPEAMAHVFKPFYSTRHGSGLGLAVVAKIVRSHQAEIRIDSEPGCGTIVALSWPSVALERAHA